MRKFVNMAKEQARQSTYLNQNVYWFETPGTAAQDRLIFQQDNNKLIFLDVDEVFSCKKVNNALFNTINLRGSVNSKCINI